MQLIAHLYNMFRSTLMPALEIIRARLPYTDETQTLFRGIQSRDGESLEALLLKIKGSALSHIKSWSSSLAVALSFGTPNYGLSGNFHPLHCRMEKMG